MRGYIQARGKDTWRIFISLGRDPATGKYKRATYTVHGTKKDAEARLAELLHQLNVGEFAEPTKTTFGQFLDRWLQECSFSDRSREWYEMVVNRHIKPLLGQMPLSKLSSLHIQEYFRRAKRQDGKGEALSPNTLHGHFRIMHSALNQAVAWGLLPKNPADGVKPPTRRRGKSKALPPEGIAKLLELAKPRRYYALYLGAIATGMRQGELLGLRWQDVDLNAGLVHVQQALVQGGRHPKFGPAKTENANRYIPLPSIFVEALKELKEAQDKEKEFYGDQYADFGLVFTTLQGWPLLRSNVDRDLAQILKKAGLPVMRFHDLRHSHATWLLISGVDIKTVSQRLGHSSSSTTLDIYSHVLSAMQDGAAKAIDSLLRNNDRNGEKP